MGVVKDFVSSDLGWLTGPIKLGYESLNVGSKALFGHGLNDKPPQPAKVAAPEKPKDLTDQAILDMMTRKLTDVRLGNTRSSNFIGGQLGDMSGIPSNVKSFLE